MREGNVSRKYNVKLSKRHMRKDAARVSKYTKVVKRKRDKANRIKV